ncbi:TIGR01212 family radical SAM protein [Candidatus Cyanaurora vandensis]|uniref:TIGR01212 family radical SAM protein n=1 Tax=Candidatus Cyanaurora vandensis TaxID=2714958 RepID=UPI00257A39C5|nr:TIGR01212 family radical SAM protein [Candidatus Cyanaurora vandensis]
MLPYNQHSEALKRRFGQKIFKVTLDAGFNCPNRDGNRAWGGCTFCDASGSSAQIAPPTMPLAAQLTTGIAKWQDRFGSKAQKFIAYYQAFTNTYAPLERLREVYQVALDHPDVVGLAIGTRPDAVPDSVLDLLAEIAQQKYLWVEYGLQSAHNSTLDYINRAHTVEEYSDAVQRTQARGLDICGHLIHGLPGETPQMMLQSVQKLVDLGVTGIKIHSLHILKGSVMAQQYRRGEIPMFSQQDYVTWVCDSLELLPWEVEIHRLTGDGLKHLLIAPEWSQDKRKVLEAIQREMQYRGTRQGAKARQAVPKTSGPGSF